MSAFYIDQAFHFIKPQIKVETDIIVVFTHFMLGEVGFRCLVTNSEQGEKKTSLFLPNNWNENSDEYSLRYILGDEAFVMIGTVVDENIILNLLSEETLQCTAIAVSIKETVKSIDGTTLLELIPNYIQVSLRLNDLLIEPFRNGILNDSGSSTSSGERQRKIGAYRNPDFQRYRTLQRSKNHKSKKKSTSLYILCLKNNYNKGIYKNDFQRFTT